VSLSLSLLLWRAHDPARNIVQCIEVEIINLNEALARMESLITRSNEPSEYELLGKCPMRCIKISSHIYIFSARLDRLRPLQSAYHNSQNAANNFENQEEVTLDILDWLTDFGQPMVYWLYGDRRSTTTAIAQSIAIQAHQEDRLVSSFFFAWNGDAASRDATHLIPTVMYKMARFDKDFLRCITRTIGVEPDIRDRKASEQISFLVDMSFRDYEETVNRPLLIVIDALDTCNLVHDPAIARDIAMFIQALSKMPMQIKIFITSRFTQVTSQISQCSEFPRYCTCELPPSIIRGNQSPVNVDRHILESDDDSASHIHL
jgi:hypothetical protein